MALNRKPFQGVFNIVRFNWHFYVLTGLLMLALLIVAAYFDGHLRWMIYTICMLAILPVVVSLLASYYVYDLSGIYSLKWIDESDKDGLIINVNAGFDETSALLREKLPSAELMVLDFYDPGKHTEVSINRARKAYPMFPGTRQTSTTKLPAADKSAELIFAILAAHEIRNDAERAAFFKELARIIKPTGSIYVTEHLRDLPNFLAYTIGFFHFYSKRSWLNTFGLAGLKVAREIKLNPFISTFVLTKDGHTL